MVESAKAGKMKALDLVGTNPVARFGIDPFALLAKFVVVQDMFLTETATIADVVLPAATLTKNPEPYQYLRRPADCKKRPVRLPALIRFRNDCPHRVPRL